ncbi:uncharacterized protein LOC115760702 isoform X1 [Drosophila novamexicana]|uniref:uncharacterized protein LOC115760702 isoform X1 n=1 Tax=Drosophila novamexicana TaxID=47314 RepID=UPI0011E5D4D3|nr:uncharacterized protein LOC115760702 isoform X1 [Drosophila novamexicana]
MASAAQNWSGLVTLCLGQEREKRQTSSQRTSLTKCNVAAALGAPPKAPVRYMPSYRLEPKNPLNTERLELTMRTIMNKNYNEDYLFHPRQSYHLAAQVSEEIKNSIKLLNFDRWATDPPSQIALNLCLVPAQISLRCAGDRWRAADAGPLLHGELPVGCRQRWLCHLHDRDAQICGCLHHILFVLRLSV